MKDRMLSKEMREKLMGEIGRNDKFIELIGIRIVQQKKHFAALTKQLHEVFSEYLFIF